MRIPHTSTFRRTAFWTLLLSATLVPATHLDAADWAEKMFNKQKHDFGVIARGAEAQYRFQLKNPYKQTIHIANVRTTCGCSAATPTKKTLKTNDTAEIVVTMDTNRFIRRKDSNLIVTFDQPVYAQVTIPITAYIRTDVVITPGSANFGNVGQGSSKTTTLNIAYAGRSDWRITGVKTGNKHITGKVTETSRGNGQVNYKLEMTLGPKMPVGSFRIAAMLETDDESSRNVPLMVRGTVEADISVTNAPLGTVPVGGSTTFNVVVRGRKAFRIAKIECPQSPDCFKARVPDRESTIHVVPITFSPKQSASIGEFKKTLQITITDRTETVPFEVRGQIASQ